VIGRPLTKQIKVNKKERERPTLATKDNNPRSTAAPGIGWRVFPQAKKNFQSIQKQEQTPIIFSQHRKPQTNAYI
jgi:hypothetical protein